MAGCERAGRLHALPTAGSVSVHAVNPVVSAADFANRGRACPLGMTQRHEQPVADGQLSGNIAEYAFAGPAGLYVLAALLCAPLALGASVVCSVL